MFVSLVVIRFRHSLTESSRGFGIRADPGQTKNLVKNKDYQIVLKEHRQLLRDWVKQTKSPFPLEKIP
jgi:hypothetical protein